MIWLTKHLMLVIQEIKLLFLIGLGLNEKGISQEGLESVKKCSKIYLEDYTVEFPYSKENLRSALSVEVEDADREKVEQAQELVEEAKEQNVALLVYGSPLTATTHITLLQECKRQNIECKVIYNASVIDAVAECGLQLYKFGKIASIPEFEANSFAEIVRENQRINAHSLILVDIGLEFEKAIERLRSLIEIDKLLVCSRLGCEDKKIYYGSFEELKERNIKAPFCFVVPGKLHFLEQEILKGFK